MPISPIRPQAAWMPPLPKVIKTEAQTNDPTQHFSVDGNYLRLSGDASNSGFAASTASLSFDGQSVSVQLSGGMTPYQTFQALEQAMPQGYRLKLVHEAGKDLLLEVVSTTQAAVPTPAPQPPAPAPTDDFSPTPPSTYNPAPGMPPLPQLVKPELSSNDPVQKLAYDSTGQIRIAGVAANNGFAPSQVSLQFDGHNVSVALNGGMTPYQTYEALQHAMPEGYRANLVFQAPHSEADVLIEITKRPGSNPAAGDWLA